MPVGFDEGILLRFAGRYIHQHRYRQPRSGSLMVNSVPLHDVYAGFIRDKRITAAPPLRCWVI